MVIKFVLLAVSRVYSTAVGLFLVLMSAEFMGLEERGKIAISVTWVTALFTFLHLSIGQLSYRIVINDKKRVNEMITYFIVYDLLLTVILFVFYPFIYHLFVPAKAINLGEFYLALPLVPIMMFEQQMLSLFLALQDTNKLNKITVINKSINLVVTTCLIYLYPDYMVFIICLFMLSFFMSISYFLGITEKYRLKFDRIEFTKLLAKGGGFHFFNAFGYIAYTSLPLLILPNLLITNDFALYEIGFKLISVVLIIATSSQLLSMRVFSKELDLKVAWKKYLNVIFLYFILSYSIVFFYMLLHPFLLDIGVLKKYYLSFEVLHSLLPYVPLIGTALFLPTLFVNFEMMSASALYNIILGGLGFILLIGMSYVSGVAGVLNALKIVYVFSGLLFFLIIRHIHINKI